MPELATRYEPGTQPDLRLIGREEEVTPKSEAVDIVDPSTSPETKSTEKDYQKVAGAVLIELFSTLKAEKNKAIAKGEDVELSDPRVIVDNIKHNPKDYLRPEYDKIRLADTAVDMKATDPRKFNQACEEGMDRVYQRMTEVSPQHIRGTYDQALETVDLLRQAFSGNLDTKLNAKLRPEWERLTKELIDAGENLELDTGDGHTTLPLLLTGKSVKVKYYHDALPKSAIDGEDWVSLVKGIEKQALECAEELIEAKSKAI